MKEVKNDGTILNEKLMFIWDNILVLNYCKSVRKVNRVKVNMDMSDLYKMLIERIDLKETDYYKDYSKVLAKITNTNLLDKNKTVTFKEREELIIKSFPVLANSVNYIYDLALNRLNETLYKDTEKGIDILYKNGNIYNKDTFTVIRQLIKSSDDIDKSRLYLYLVNLSEYISKDLKEEHKSLLKEFKKY